jgi:hypothetical protein
VKPSAQTHLVRIRVSGPAQAVALVAEVLRRVDVFEVAEESDDYRNRRDPGVRRYLNVLVSVGDGRG